MWQDEPKFAGEQMQIQRVDVCRHSGGGVDWETGTDIFTNMGYDGWRVEPAV